MQQFKRSALIGYTGFVGSNLNLKYNFTCKYNSKNINEILNEPEFDCVVCAGISAVKWWANLHEEEDLQNIMNLLNVLQQVKTKKFVLISTIDVYCDISEGDEDTVIDYEKCCSYGKNRYIVEQFVKSNFEDHHIIRLPALFGYGLKKNIIYDYLNDKLCELNLASSLQWYYLGNLFNDLIMVIEKKIRLINLFFAPIYNQELHFIFSKYKKMNYVLCSKNQINYNLRTKYEICERDEIREIDKYIRNMLCDRLTVSNLAWTHFNDEDMLGKLKVFGINKLEVSPYKYFKGGEFNDLERRVEIYAFQSILYPQTFNLFVEPEVVIGCLERVIKIAGKLGVKVLVFGSPKNRKRGEISYEDAMQKAITFFKRVGQIAFENDVVMAIEPNARCYGCDFVINSSEGRELVEKVGMSSFRLHLDIGCMYLEGEDVMECIKGNLDILKHVHISAPNLDSLRMWTGKIDYRKLYLEIKGIYGGMLSIEELGKDDLEILRDVMYLVE